MSEADARTLRAAGPVSAARIKAVANGRARLSVHRSGKQIYAQVIDDAKGVTARGGLDARQGSPRRHQVGRDMSRPRPRSAS